ncbi:MAG: hypothetical protein ACLR7F_12185 [Waltera sp.]
MFREALEVNKFRFRQNIRRHRSNERVYTCFCTDVIHEGHRNIIREAGKYGELTIGVLSDAAMIRFNRFPTISFEERMQLVKDIPEVSNVVVQDDVMYDKVIEELRPDYVIHGDNWQREL